MQWKDAEPILRRTYALMEASGMMDGQAVVENMGLSGDDGRRAFDALRTAGYIGVDGERANGIPFIIKPTALGLQYCSGWPAPGMATTFLSELLGAIAERAKDSAVPEDEKGRLRSFLQAAGNMPKELLAEITTKLIEGQTGL